VADAIAGERYVTRDAPVDHTRGTQRILVLIIAVLSIILALELVYHLVLAPRLVIDRIEVESNLPLTDTELLSLAGVRVGMPYFGTDVEEITHRILAHPVVRDAQVVAGFPNRLSITATRRTPLAVALAQTPDGVVPLVFDEQGVVFQLGLSDASAELPVVSGLRFATVGLGLELPAQVVDFLDQLRSLRMEAPELYRLFSEYRIVQKNEYAYEVVLYPMHFALPVRIGTSIDSDMVQYVMMMLDVLHREGRLSTLAELDFRDGEGVLRPRTRPVAPGEAARAHGSRVGSQEESDG
jgi:cell division protein FtsQ